MLVPKSNAAKLSVCILAFVGCSSMPKPEYPTAQAVTTCAESTLSNALGNRKSGTFMVESVGDTRFKSIVHGKRYAIRYRMDRAVPQIAMIYNNRTGPEGIKSGLLADTYPDIPIAENVLKDCARPDRARAAGVPLRAASRS